MKKHYIIYLLLLCCPLMLQSCLKDDDDTFSQSATQRMQTTLQNIQKTLTASKYGWVLEDFPESSQKYGGYAFTCQFNDSTVLAMCEDAVNTLAGTSSTRDSSLYALKEDQGPVLSIDGYNDVLHAFSTPSSKNYQGKNGDFEYIVDECTDSLIKLHARRTGNVVYMRALQEPAEEYIAQVNNEVDNIAFSELSGKVGTDSLEGELDFTNRQLYYINASDTAAELQQVPFCYTPTGLRFYQPVTFGGETITGLTADLTNVQFTTITTSGASSVIKGTYPEGYTTFEDFEGTYTIMAGSPTPTAFGTIQLVPDKANNQYLMKGLCSKYDVKLPYNKAQGCLQMMSQQLGTNSDGNLVWLCAWSLQNGGQLTWDSSEGMLIKSGTGANAGKLVFSSTGTLGTDSYILWMTDDSGASKGQLDDADWAFYNRTTQLRNIKYLVKK